jgi:1-deoxy-D-xylulose-5-phosphate synthase
MNDKVVGITPAMASGCGMNQFAKEMPGRFYDVGIEEEHAVTFAAGLAAGGMKPFCNIYSSFSQRSYDQIFHDVALQNLPVAICLDRAGLVGEDGATHHGCYDMAIYRTLPGAIIAAPKDEVELKNMMYSAMLSENGPYIIRYPRGYGEGAPWKESEFTALTAGQGEKIMEGKKIAIICAGPFCYRAKEAAEKILAEKGWNPAIYNIRYIKPLDVELLEEICAGFSEVVTIEDGSIVGGLHGAVAEYVSQNHIGVKVTPIAIPDRYLSQGTQNELRDECGLTTDRIYELLEQKMKKIAKKD